ncbi:ribosome-binding protein 1 isoform X1 [Malaya genurostris]|uniref:ribosome-binding protein 1 isoform X1 n=1 Tax=Malaya genurostris TaxID=325434 RepID=UPI0026F3AD2B|nr:ribosome-binding protein 1 isoform X1 [Malaya genurostris]XP_058447506.1 ribosome-binding protein 1 isoform X1 [Malaya genurostris]XP_058447507.1 ribosome-binding protein 1 isoform X1 [Malaya genurostris]
MDLSIFVVILVGTLLSLLGLHFFLLKPLSGKSFEEMLKEKREMREKILGTGGANLKSSKDNANKKAKKANKKPQQQKQKVSAVIKESDQDSGEIESDTNSSESPLEEEINPLTYAKKKVNSGVEYAETESFPLNEGQSKKKENKPVQGKKNKQKGGILINKTEPVLVKPEPAPEINHFEVTHPKDAVEIARQHVTVSQKEEAIKTKSQSKEQRKNKVKDQNKPIPKTSAVEEIPVVPVVAPVIVAEVPKVETKPSAQVGNKEKSNKKKKNELITQQLAAEVQDAANVQSLVRILAKADLPRNDIQILIDFLLNKQQDTLTKDPSEWNDPSDPLQKLKKQLQEKENQLQEEQKGSAGLHAKLKELRQELNSDKVQHSSLIKSYNEELHAKRIEQQNLQQQLQILSEKFTAEKQSLSHQYQQLHAKFIQLSKEHTAAQENVATISQLNENQQILQRELMTKGQLLNEKLQIEEELVKKNAEYEMLLRSKDEMIQQRVQDIGAYENELQQLRVVANQKDELAKQQSYELEQLKAQVDELQAKQKQAAAAVVTAAAVKTQVEENSKVEIRNLQNALDSSNTELTVCRTDLADSKNKLIDQEQQTAALRSRMDELQQEIEEQKARNNDLRMKNWKLIEALQVAQNNTIKSSTNTISSSKVELKASSQNSSNHVDEPVAQPAPVVDVDKIILEEQGRTKDLLIKLLPTEIVSTLPLDATNFHSWLEATVTCIREQQESLRVSNASSDSNSTGTQVHLNCNNNTSRSSNSTNNNNSSLYENDDAHDGKTEGSSSSKNGAPTVYPVEDPQALAAKNEQLQKTIEQYKLIIAETEIMLKNLESKASGRGVGANDG